MNVSIIYLFLIITLFNVCVSRKSGLYPNQNNDNAVEEDVQYDNQYDNQYEYNNYDPYAEQAEQNRRKSSLNTNQQQNQNENQEQSQDTTNGENSQNNEVRTRHLYKYSFKKPYYYYNDTDVIPNWEQRGGIFF